MGTSRELFQLLHDHRGSDLHLSTGCAPRLRIHGELIRADLLGKNIPEEVTEEGILTLLRELAPPDEVSWFEATGDVDFACELPGLARYRVNFFRQRRGPGAVFREIPQQIPTLDALGLPDALQELALLPKGLVLVTGPTGSGKTTTLAALLECANVLRHDHILTIEDPVEYLHTSQNCLVNQREIGQDSHSFASALRSALREDPDILLVGEMRDLETISLAIEAAETGHLVFATLHTLSAAKTIDRIVEVFPPQQQPQIRSSLAESLQAILGQVLLKRTDGKGRIPALEILKVTPAIRNLIRESKTFQIPNILQTSRAAGMQTLDDELCRLVSTGMIASETALPHALDPQRILAAANESGSTKGTSLQF